MTYKKIKWVYVLTLLDFWPLHWAYHPCDGNGLTQTFSIIVNKWKIILASFHSFSTFFCPKVSSRSFAFSTFTSCIFSISCLFFSLLSFIFVHLSQCLCVQRCKGFAIFCLILLKRFSWFFVMYLYHSMQLICVQFCSSVSHDFLCLSFLCYVKVYPRCL